MAKLRKIDEAVDHPAHYSHGGVEAIDVIEAWDLGFSLGNCVKYISRADHKGKRLEDLRKASWYLLREIGREESAAKMRNAHCVQKSEVKDDESI